MRRLPEGILGDRDYAAWCDLADHLLAKRARPLTIENYGWALVQLHDYLAAHHKGIDITACTHQHINGYLGWLAARGGRNGAPASPDTVDTRYRALRRCWRYWLDAGYVAENIIRLVPAPRLPDKLVPVVQADATRALFAACSGKLPEDRRDLAMIRLALTPGGPRASELCGLVMDDIDMRAGVVLLHGKGGKDRVIAMGPATRQALNRYLAVRAARPDARTTNRVFLGQRGPLTRSGWKQLLIRRCREAGLAEINPHRLRHTIAAQCKANKMDPETAKLLFGWSTDAMYGRYGRSAAAALAVEHGRELANLLEAS